MVYLDTSALVKLYVEEEGTGAVRRVVMAADDVITSVVAYAEARAALARAHRERVLTKGAHRSAVLALDQDFRAFSVVGLPESLSQQAGALAEKHALRGFDAIHLASALLVIRGLDDASFGCFDQKLAASARREGLQLSPF